MEQREYLNEDNYQKSKKKVIAISVAVLIIGILLGGVLIFKGVTVKNDLQNKAKEQQEQEKLEKEQQNEISNKKEEEKNKRIDELNKLINDTQKKIDEAEVDLTKLRNEQTKIFEQDRGFSDRYNAKEVEITKKTNEKNNLSRQLSEYKLELSRLKNTSYISEFEKIYNNSISTNNVFTNKSKYNSYFLFGGFIIFTSCIFSAFIYLIAKRREIMAFTAQQTIPIAKESMEKMSDTVSKVSGDMAREISKGIEEGKSQAKVPHVVRCPHCGADNEIIGKTGKCEYCQSKISYKE